MSAGQIGFIHPALSEVAVQIQETCARLAKISGQRGQERAGAHDVAARRLALQALTQPKKRWAPRIQLRHLLDQTDRNAGLAGETLEVAGGNHGFQLIPPFDMACHERFVDQPVAMNHVQEGKDERGIAPREGL